MNRDIIRPEYCKDILQNPLYCNAECSTCKPKETRYKLERRAFVNYYSIKLFQLANIDTIREDLILGGEFILTAEEMLANLTQVEGKLVGVTGTVDAKQCDLYFEQ